MSTNRITKTYDNALVLHSYDTAYTSSHAGADTANTAIVVDLGAGLVEGDIILDVETLDVNDAADSVVVGVQVSNVAALASAYYETIALHLGHATAVTGDTAMGTGRYIIPFNNTIADGVQMRYLRLYFTIANVAGFNCKAYLAKK
jgi:hypothetical protein